MKQFLILLLFVFYFLSPVFSQQIAGNDIRLAFQYYQNKDFDKAEVLFKKIAEKTSAKVYYTYYVNCLIEQGKFDLAEKSVKKQIRKHRNEASYYIDLGYIYKAQNLFEDARKYYRKAVKKVGGNPALIRSVATAFMQRREYEYAEEIYLKGRKNTRNDFRNELANLYAVQRKYDKMINEYLDLLQENSRNLNRVQNRMQNFIDKDINDEFSDILRKELLKRIQKTNSSIAFNRMLVWYFMQRKEFGQALIQAKAIDKRTNSSGRSIINLAETAKANHDFETALDAYEYVISKGTRKPFFIEANVGKLNLSYLKIIEGTDIKDEDVAALEQEYMQSLNRLGIGFNTIQSVLDLADLKTFYGNKAAEAEKLLKDALQLKGLDTKLVAECQIKLGDVYLYQNETDLAALTYAKVEIDNKGDAFGDRAKLKKAKLAYYVRNFLWAKVQFDALKESTSKLVANDAMFYALLIDDNSEEDSLQSALKIYSEADLNMFRRKYKTALSLLDSLQANFAGHQIIDESYLLKAEIYQELKEWQEAEKWYKKLIAEYAYDILADHAMFQLAFMYEHKLNDKEQAAEYYKKLMLEHANSIFVTEARRNYRKIRASRS